MKSMSSIIWSSIITIIAGIGVYIYVSYFVLRTRLDNKENIIEAINDTLKIKRNEDSSTSARIMAFETSKMKDFLTIKTKDSTIIELQKLVKQYRNKLGKEGSATVFSSSTDLNTVVPTELQGMQVNPNGSTWPIYKSDINLSDWIVGQSIAYKDSTRLKLSIKNEYSVVIGDEGGWFKKRKPFVEVTNKNPYSNTQTLRTYRVAGPRPKRFGIGLHAGYGVSFQQVPKLTPIIGIGINYNLIEF